MDDGAYEERMLSSSLTMLFKVVFPLVWIGGFAVGTAAMFLTSAFLTPASSSSDLGDDKWFFLGATLLGSALLYVFVMRLKVVALRGDTLRIESLGREIMVPLSNVERVTGSVLLTPELVWIDFRQPTELGSRVMFVPKWRLLAGFTVHPVVAELNDLVKKASF